MRLQLLLCLLVVASCGMKKQSLKVGESSRAQILAEKGEDYKEESIPRKNGKILVFKDGEKYQLDGDVLVTTFKDPSGDEQQVIFWKHKFKDCLTTSTKLPKKNATHQPPEIELSCPEEGISVIYTEGSNLVNRIVEFEKK